MPIVAAMERQTARSMTPFEMRVEWSSKMPLESDPTMAMAPVQVKIEAVTKPSEKFPRRFEPANAWLRRR